MRPLVLLLALAILGTAAPVGALAEPHGHGGGGGGGWRGGGERGGAPFGRGGMPGGAPFGGGRWGGRAPPPFGGRYRPPEPAPGPGPGPFYAEPPRGRYGNSLGEYYREQQDEAREGVRHGGYRSMGQVMQNIRRRMPGRPLDAGLEQWRDGRPVYRVRWAAADGRRIDYIIDAQSGAILETEGQ